MRCYSEVLYQMASGKQWADLRKRMTPLHSQSNRRKGNSLLEMDSSHYQNNPSINGGVRQDEDDEGSEELDESSQIVQVPAFGQD